MSAKVQFAHHWQAAKDPPVGERKSLLPVVTEEMQAYLTWEKERQSTSEALNLLLF